MLTAPSNLSFPSRFAEIYSPCYFLLIPRQVATELRCPITAPPNPVVCDTPASRLNHVSFKPRNSSKVLELAKMNPQALKLNSHVQVSDLAPQSAGFRFVWNRYASFMILVSLLTQSIFPFIVFTF